MPLACLTDSDGQEVREVNLRCFTMTATIPSAIGGTFGRWRRKILALHTLKDVEGRGSGTSFGRVFIVCVIVAV